MNTDVTLCVNVDVYTLFGQFMQVFTYVRYDVLCLRGMTWMLYVMSHVSHVSTCQHYVVITLSFSHVSFDPIKGTHLYICKQS
jgi:hypothetical protein